MQLQRLDPGLFTSSAEARAAAGVVRALRERGHEAYVAGGSVRDAVLGSAPHDFDVATSARPEEVHAAFADVVDTGVRYGTVTVLADGAATQVTTFRAEADYADGRRPDRLAFGVSLEEDAKRRDFTVNALYADPLTGEIVDRVGGLRDLESRVVRAVGDPAERFDEDALRLLRLVRFAAQLGARIDPETERAARARPHRLRVLSAERVREEVSRMLLGPDPGGALRRLDAYAFLDEVLPEVAAGRGVPQPPEFHPEGDVLFHTIDVVEKLDRRNLVTALAALFHDVGKVRTLTVADRIRFHGHDRVSCDLAGLRLRSLAFPRAVAEAVLELIAEHLRIGSFLSWRRAKQLRFLARLDVLDHLALHRADRLSARAGLEVHDAAIAELARLAASPAPRAPLLRGDDLLALGYPAGPRFREILEALRDEQLEGRLATREEAVRFVRDRYPLEPEGPSVR